MVSRQARILRNQYTTEANQELFAVYESILAMATATSDKLALDAVLFTERLSVDNFTITTIENLYNDLDAQCIKVVVAAALIEKYVSDLVTSTQINKLIEEIDVVLN